MCLATSTDGISCMKPTDGVFERNGSNANNILVEDSGVSVFLDSMPGVTDHELWKMVCSQNAYASPDGLSWTKLGAVRTAEDDTKPTAYYDPSIKKYVISVRRDLPHPKGRASTVVRHVGRCETTDLTDWLQSDAPRTTGCPAIFGPDEKEPDHFDMYTNAWTPYPSMEAPTAHFFFPSMYHQFGSTPWGFGNEGLLDICLAVSQDAKNISYVEARNG